jgi:PilZ domain-containing protein
MESETQNHLEASRANRAVDERRCPRFKLDVDIAIQARDGELLQGRTVDISESGIAAILKIEVAVGLVVQLDFSFPFHHVSLLAVVKQRNAFRYGFQFADPGDTRELIGRVCERLAPCP